MDENAKKAEFIVSAVSTGPLLRSSREFAMPRPPHWPDQPRTWKAWFLVYPFQTLSR
jgi:hypothetical protein